MSQSLAISITLCHQFKSIHYNTAKLKSCIIQAAQESESMLDDVNMVFEDIEEATHANLVHENVISSIRKSHIIIFEISDVNPNVLYELGIANGLKKPIIILRECKAQEELPTDVNQFMYLTYDKNELDKFSNKLARSITKAYSSYDEMDLISEALQSKIIDRYMLKRPNEIFDKLNQNNLVKILKSKDEYRIAFDQTIASTKVNFYYIGTMGFLSSGDQWLDLYIKHFEESKVFSRIVYLQTLKEFHNIYDDEEMLIDYCLWLSQNYYLLKNKIISMNISQDVGIWKNGISIVVSDEEKLLISTGSFGSEYNNKGFLINNEEISQVFKEYAKILAIKSKKIKSRNLIEYFSFGDKLKELPETIKAVLDKKDFSELRRVCEKYVYKNISKI